MLDSYYRPEWYNSADLMQVYFWPFMFTWEKKYGAWYLGLAWPLGMTPPIYIRLLWWNATRWIRCPKCVGGGYMRVWWTVHPEWCSRCAGNGGWYWWRRPRHAR